MDAEEEQLELLAGPGLFMLPELCCFTMAIAFDEAMT